MNTYTTHELSEALRAVNSIIQKCEKALEKFSDGSSQHSLLRNRLAAMYISKTLLKTELLPKTKRSSKNAKISKT